MKKVIAYIILYLAAGVFMAASCTRKDTSIEAFLLMTIGGPAIIMLLFFAYQFVNDNLFKDE